VPVEMYCSCPTDDVDRSKGTCCYLRSSRPVPDIESPWGTEVTRADFLRYALDSGCTGQVCLSYNTGNYSHLCSLTCLFSQDPGLYWKRSYARLVEKLNQQGQQPIAGDSNGTASNQDLQQLIQRLSAGQEFITLKKNVAVLNAHFRFTNPPKLDVATNKRRRELEHRRQGTVAGTSSVPAPSAGVHSQAHAARATEPPPSITRNAPPPLSLEGMVNPDTMQPMGPSTNFEIDDLYRPPVDGLADLEQHNVAALFPDFQRKINQLRNQNDLAVQVAKKVMKHYCQAITLLHSWQQERRRIVQASSPIFKDLDRLAEVGKQLELRLLSLLTDSEILEQGLSHLAEDIGGMEVDEGAEAEEVVAEAVNTVIQDNIIIPLKGQGYLGEDIEVWRIDIRKPRSIKYTPRSDPKKGNKKRRHGHSAPSADNMECYLPVGSYFYKKDIVTLCGAAFAEDDEDYKKFMSWVRGMPWCI